MTLNEARAHIGDGVVYRTAYGRTEDGVITSVSDRFVFVRYEGRWQSESTEPASLSLLTVTQDAPDGAEGHQDATGSAIPVSVDPEAGKTALRDAADTERES
jgi:hypothetical protein